MIRALVDFALNNRFLIVLATLMFLIWGAISFHNLPVEAYPDVANNYVQVITQWPGRAAEGRRHAAHRDRCGSRSLCKENGCRA